MRLDLVTGSAIVFGIAVAMPASAAETVQAPRLLAGDSWTYAEGNLTRAGSRIAHVTMTLVRADKSGIAVEVHPSGTPGPGAERLLGPDWSRIRSVNGRQVTVNQPLAFPLSPGKTWRVAYTEFTPADHRHTREGWDMTMRVKGWESVDVPAGSFRALKIEGDGTWTADTPSSIVVARGRAPGGAEIASAQRNPPTTISGRYFKAFWYVPEVHRWVKSEEDYFDANGVRTGHSTSDLEAFALGDPHGTSQPAENEMPAASAAKPHHAKVPRASTPPAAPKPPPLEGPAQLRETRLGNGWNG